MTPFRWTKGNLVADFEPYEAQLMRQVVEEIGAVLRGEVTGDPALGEAEVSDSQADHVSARLLPDGHRSDPALAADYRDLTESGLRQEKLADSDLLLETLPETGGRIELDAATAEAWLRTINDVRLALGVRLEVDESDDPMLRAEQTGDPRWAAYSWLTAVQSLLIEEMSQAG